VECDLGLTLVLRPPDPLCPLLMTRATDCLLLFKAPTGLSEDMRGVLGVARMSVGRYCRAGSHAGDVDEEKLSALRKIYSQPPGNSTNVP